MATTTDDLPAADVNSYDYVIVGGGTAGCVIGSRLAEYLPNKRILIIEGGPSDYMDDRVLNLREWLNLLGGELDYDYPTTEQPMGMLPPIQLSSRGEEISNCLQATVISVTRAPRSSVAAPATTPSSRSDPSSTMPACGRKRAAKVGRSRPSPVLLTICATRSSPSTSATGTSSARTGFSLAPPP